MTKKFYARYISVLLIVFGMGYILGGYNNNHSLSEVLPKDVNSNPNVLITYAEYQQFFSYIKENIKIGGLKIKYASSKNNYHIIDKKWSFGTRDRLLLNNEDYLRPTEEFLILENSDQSCQLTINICYNPEYIGNNLHYLVTSNSDIMSIDPSLTQNTNSCMLSYNNLIIGIQQGRKNTDVDYLVKSLEEIVQITEDYFRKSN